MARTPRIAKSLDEKLRDLDHHQFLLRDSLHGLRRDIAYLKSLATELRTLICFSSGTEGLLWRITDELGVSDTIPLEAIFSMDKDHPINKGLSFATIPLRRPSVVPSIVEVKPHSLRSVIKDYDAVFLSSFDDRRITHESLIKAIAQQMGSAHEDDGVEPKLRRLQNIFLNGTQPYIPILAFDAELTLQVGERVLDHCEARCNYKRATRQRDPGNLTLIVRCVRRASLAGPIPLLVFRSEISEVEIRCEATPQSFVFSVSKREKEIHRSHIPFDFRTDLSLFALSYSSELRQVRFIINNGAESPTDCDLGWLDPREIGEPTFYPGYNEFVCVDLVLAYERLLSSSQCADIASHPTSDLAFSLRQNSVDLNFPD